MKLAHGATLFIGNSAIMPNDGTFRKQRITTEFAVEMLADNPEFVSSIGHQGAADFCTEVLGVQVPLNRIFMQMKEGDANVVLTLKSRIPEGAVLSKDEMMALDFEFALVERIA